MCLHFLNPECLRKRLVLVIKPIPQVAVHSDHSDHSVVLQCSSDSSMLSSSESFL